MQIEAARNVWGTTPLVIHFSLFNSHFNLFNSYHTFYYRRLEACNALTFDHQQPFGS